MKKIKDSNCRIMIFGIPGAGKSTFSFNLHKKLSIPVYHLDKYMFLDGGKKRDKDEFLSLQQKIVNYKEWIIDGASKKSLEMRWSRATIVLFFNYLFLVCLWRVLKRSFFGKDKNIDDKINGKQERISWNMIKYMWNYKSYIKNVVAELKIKYPDTNFYEIKSDKDLIIVNASVIRMFNK